MSANSRLTIAIHILTMLHVRGESLSSAFMAGSVNTNPVVIRRLLADLTRAGLVQSQKGNAGGYQLAKNAAEITLAEVYNALGETALFGMHPAQPNPLCDVGRSIQGKLQPVYDGVLNTVLKQLQHKTIADFTP
jgi:Rrf2 family protein